MTWFAQVRHVMMKDLKLARWNMVVYLLLVTLSTALACSSWGISSALPFVLMLVLVLYGMIVIAWLVQSDSPTQANVFWASRPFHPTAMLAAKLSFALVILIGVPAIGEIMGLSAYGVSAGDIPPFLVRSAWVYGVFLLMAIILAAVTKDIQTFVIALIVGFVSLTVIDSLWLASPAAHAPPGVGRLATVGFVPFAPLAWIGPIVGVGGGLALLAFLYRSHDGRRRVSLLGVLTVLCLSWSFDPGSSSAAAIDAPTSIPRVPIAAELLRSVNEQLAVRVTAPIASDSEWLTLVEPVLTIHVRGGATTLVMPMSSSRADLSEPLPPLPGTSWIDTTLFLFDRRNQGAQLQVTLDDAQRQAIESGIVSASLDGRIAVMDSHAGSTFPIQTGAFARGDRRELRIEQRSSGVSGLSLRLSTSWIPSASDPTVAPVSSHLNLVEFALVNQARGQALPLRRQGSSSFAASLVLPGVDLRQETVNFSTSKQDPAPSAARMDDAWLHDARLMIVNWTQHGSYPVHAEVTIQPPPSR